MARKEKFDYFGGFVKIGDCAVEYAEQLLAFFEKNRAAIEAGEQTAMADSLAAYHELHKIECASDEVAHEIYSHLACEFITPIEREDIQELAGELDDIVDSLDEILQHVYMYNVTHIRPEAIQMCEVLVRNTKAVRDACEHFVTFKKNNNVREHIIEVNTCEEEGDKLYMHAMHRVFSGDGNPLEAFAWSKVLTSMEKCCDTCENAAEVMQMVMMKNL